MKIKIKTTYTPDINDRHFISDIKSIKKIHINDIVYCLNNNSHSFICENVVAHNCVGGCLCKGDTKIKQRYLKFLINNKHRCFLEIQHHNDPLQIEYNKILYTISQRFGISLIAGTDSHAVYQEQIKGRLIEQKSHVIWIHFAVKPSCNRRRTNFKR